MFLNRLDDIYFGIGRIVWLYKDRRVDLNARQSIGRNANCIMVPGVIGND